MASPSLRARSPANFRLVTVALVAIAVLAAMSVAVFGTALSDSAPEPAAPLGGKGDNALVAAQAPRAVDLPGQPGDREFSTFLGGREWDEATGVATDSAGNTYVTGFTLSRNFPVVGAGTRGPAAIVDAFVTKVAADRGRIVWSTHLGGVDLDTATAITLDPTGNVYVAGRTGSPNFPVTGGLQPALAGRACTGAPCHDAFVAKLSPAGRLLWSTYFGGSGNEEALGIAVSTDRSVFVTGLTDSRDLPVRRALMSSFQSLPCEGDLPCSYDAFVTKLAPSGDRITYSTYLGGAGSDFARAVTVDDADNAYVTGTTDSPDFPTVRAIDGSLGGRACGPPPGEPCREAFLTKLTPSGETAAYSTFVGGTDHDDGYGVAVDDQQRAHVTGSTQSTDFPTRSALQPQLDNEACATDQPEELCDDGFVTKFTPDGQALSYSTYLGGRAEDQGLTIDVATSGDALVAGRTDSSDFPTREAVQAGFGGYIDGFATRLQPDGTLVWSTFIGGTDADRATGVSADTAGAAHVVGRTLSPDFPTVRPIQPALHDDDYDTFVDIIK